jgi:hypothetical protein
MQSRRVEKSIVVYRGLDGFSLLLLLLHHAILSHLTSPVYEHTHTSLAHSPTYLITTSTATSLLHDALDPDSCHARAVSISSTFPHTRTQCCAMGRPKISAMTSSASERSPRSEM